MQKEKMLKIEELLSTARDHLVVIASDSLLIDAAKILKTPRADLLVVCDENGTLAGIITNTNIVESMSACNGCGCTVSVLKAMKNKVIFCKANDSLQDVWAIFQKTGLKNIPIIDDNFKPVGVHNVRDVLKMLLDDAQYDEKLLYDYVMGVGYR